MGHIEVDCMDQRAHEQVVLYCGKGCIVYMSVEGDLFKQKAAVFSKLRYKLKARFSFVPRSPFNQIAT